MKKVTTVIVFAVCLLVCGVGAAQQNSIQPDENFTVDAPEQSVMPPGPTVIRDGTGQSAYHRDALLANAVEKLSGSVASLAAKMEGGAPQSEIDKGIVALSQEADAIPDLSKQQRAQVRRMIDRAIIKAGTGDIAGLKKMKADIAGLASQVADHEARITKLERAAPAAVVGTTGTVTDMIELSRDCTLANAQAAEALRIAEELKAQADALKAEPAGTVTQDDIMKVAQAAGDAKGRADLAQKKAEEAMELVRANQGNTAVDSAVIAEIKSRLDAVDKAVEENREAIVDIRKLAQSSDKKAAHAEEMAAEALRVAKEKADPGMVEVGVNSLFSFKTTAFLGEGTYWIRKYGFRMGFGGGVGYGQTDEDKGWSFDTRLKGGYAVCDYFWLGGYVSMYGTGKDLHKQTTFGYSGGIWLKGIYPEIRQSGIGLGLEGWVGGAFEYYWTDAEPPPGLIEGATYDDQKIAMGGTPIGGFGLFLIF